MEPIIVIVFVPAPIHEMEKHCNIEIAAQIYRASSTQNSMYALSSATDFLVNSGPTLREVYLILVRWGQRLFSH